MNILPEPKYGRLTPLSECCLLQNKSKRIFCLCDCGNTTHVAKYQLVSQRTQSCGCIRKEMLASRNFSHGKTNTRTYTSWSGIIQRCTNPKNKKYPRYGGRGISVCDRWLNSFEAFLEDMGECPGKEYSIDRFPDNDGDYEPGNCRWATSDQQMRNYSRNNVLEFEDKKLCISDWAVLKKIPRWVIYHRLEMGWDLSVVLNTPYTGNSKAS